MLITERLAMPLPPIDEAMRAQAAATPDHRIVHITERTATGRLVGAANVMGYRQFDDSGTHIVQEWINDKYVPQPTETAGAVANFFELELWRACAGFATLGALVAALVRAEVWAEAQPDGPGWQTVCEADGHTTVRVITSARLLDDVRRPRWRRVTGADLITDLGTVPDLVVEFNPGIRGAAGVSLLTTDLADLWAQYEQATRAIPTGHEPAHR